MATIFLRDLLINAKHGVLPEEKTTEQPFKISVEIEFDSNAAQHSDELADTLDYAAIRQTIRAVVTSTSFNLLERLAQAIADELLQDKRIQQLIIQVEKPAIFADAVPGVRLTFDR